MGGIEAAREGEWECGRSDVHRNRGRGDKNGGRDGGKKGEWEG